MNALAAIEFANSAFYDAFSSASYDQMSAVWAEDEAVFCCHPGWQPLHGRDAVLRSWAEIFSNSGPMPVTHSVLVQDRIAEMGIVCCLESVGGYGFVATNLFVRTGKIWRMVHHHAGPFAGRMPVVTSTPDPARN